ncbi:hypothetical protein HMPREF0765_4920, partial [Sphingobacterium spiritivorum ATCC 33300]
KKHMNNKLTTKRMSMKKYALIALAGLTLAACKKQGGEIPTVNPEEGKDASLSLSITSAANIGTYASTVGSDTVPITKKKSILWMYSCTVKKEASPRPDTKDLAEQMPTSLPQKKSKQRPVEKEYI